MSNGERGPWFLSNGGMMVAKGGWPSFIKMEGWIVLDVWATELWLDFLYSCLQTGLKKDTAHLAQEQISRGGIAWINAVIYRWHVRHISLPLAVFCLWQPSHSCLFFILCSFPSTNFLDWGCDCTSWEEVSLVLQHAFPKAQSRSVQHKQANPDKSNKRKPHDARRTIWPVNALQLSLFIAGCWLTQLLHIPNNVIANPVQRWWWMMLLRWVKQHINEAWIHIMGTVRGFPDCIKSGKINLPELSLGEAETARLSGRKC